MKNCTIKKIFILVFTLLVVFFVNTTTVDASDYKYKVLDPKYNPAAERLLNGELNQIDEIPFSSDKKNFDFAQFFAILATLLLPWILFSFAIKSFKRVMDKGFNIDKEIYNKAFCSSTEVSDDKTTSELNSEKKPPKSEVRKDIENFIKENEIIEKVEVKLSEINEKSSDDFVDLADLALAQTSSVSDSQDLSLNSMTDVISRNSKVIADNIQTYLSAQGNCAKTEVNAIKTENPVVTPTITKKTPNLLNTAPLTKSKGLCLVQYGVKYSLIGYIGKKVFLIRQFDQVESTEIRPRLTETKENRDKYIVRLGSYKAIVSVTDRDMKLLLEL